VLGLGADRENLTLALQGLSALRRDAGQVESANELLAQAEALSEEVEAH
jgi:hypothetical protein